MAWYEQHWGKLFIIPAILLVISIALIGFQVQQTGSFVNKGVSLSGGVSATVQIADPMDADTLASTISNAHPQADVATRQLGDAGTFIIDAANIHPDAQESAEILKAFLESTYTVDSITLEVTGPSLGEAFFEQTIIGILLAFLWMGWVVFLYFGKSLWLKTGMGVAAFACTILAVNGVISGTAGMGVLALIVLASMVLYMFQSVPAGAVILAAASTIIFTLAVINIMGVRLSTAGIAAFLMIIGYSVDTDILLSTRMLKRLDGSMYERMLGAFKTGITMQLTTTVAVLIALVLTNSEVIGQIMLILLVGMVGDIIFTWLQNAGILWWWTRRQEGRK